MSSRYPSRDFFTLKLLVWLAPDSVNEQRGIQMGGR